MAKEYKEGVDFEWVSAKDSKGNVVKDGKGNPVKTRRFFKKSEKDAMKNKPKEEAKPVTRAPKGDTKAATNAVRPTPGGPGKLPATNKPKSGGRGDGAKETERRRADAKKEDKPKAGVPVLGVAAAAAASRRTPAQGRPSNPNYPGRPGMAEGFQGRYTTEVGRPRAAGGARAIGGNPTRRGLAGAGRGILKMPDILELKNMNKGGMVKKSTVPPKTYKK